MSKIFVNEILYEDVLKKAKTELGKINGSVLVIWPDAANEFYEIERLLPNRGYEIDMNYVDCSSVISSSNFDWMLDKDNGAWIMEYTSAIGYVSKLEKLLEILAGAVIQPHETETPITVIIYSGGCYKLPDIEKTINQYEEDYYPINWMVFSDADEESCAQIG